MKQKVFLLIIFFLLGNLCGGYIMINRFSHLKEFLEFKNSHEFYPIIVTAYNSHKSQTDDSPRITSSGKIVSHKTLALSRDFISTFNSIDSKNVNYGDTVTIIVSKKFIVEDTMNKRYKNRGDIWTESKKEAINFGKQQAILVVKRKK